ncbi:ralBP1-associated Eps domain-containing protein 2-like isoform X2 [Myxocyprinus asiaticus]|uniref:ralBP1-associated Eps domain-containing protein 2-like isoform X2 n=1 Tax=Myxocyprinus asiaticus TaxID=70543 RepID=UPI002222B6C0|nr:ralBP1-associated Eps domain-containing protein 2-like isoform X2 [Myxocyprinus asiaticus]
MDQGAAAGTGGTFISLSDTEQRCYSGLYALCQPDSTGKLAAGKVAELFRASQLPAETLHQITEACGAKRLGYFGCGQFYIALKLLAAVQTGLPVRLESIAGELPLPVFVGIMNEPEMRYPNHTSTNETQIQGLVTSSTPRPPADRPVVRHPDTSMEKQEAWSPPQSPGISPPHSPSSYHCYPYGAQRNGADALLGDLSAPFYSVLQQEYTGLAGKTRSSVLAGSSCRWCVPSSRPRCLPGRLKFDQSLWCRWAGKTSRVACHQRSSAYDGKLLSRSSVPQENSSPSHYSIKLQSEQPAIARVPSVEHLVERNEIDYSDDPWRITEEQREYYTNQFKSLQPDLSALIVGTVAKNFFTKSKLPIPELSHIWELSDVDRDGALTFPEFCIAFHLIVARKNGYPLPETLPLTLRPCYVKQGVVTVPPSEVTQPLIVFDDNMTPKASQLEMSSVDLQMTPLPGVSTSKHDTREESGNSEFSPKRHPDPQEKPIQQFSTLKPDSPQELDANMKSRTRPRSYSSTSIDDAMKKVEEPPTPPPRPQKTHSRASSLDLNKLLQQSGQGCKSGWLLPPPALPPRPPATQIINFHPGSDKKAVQQPNFADFSRFREEETSSPPQTIRPGMRGSPSIEDLAPSKMDCAGLLQGHAPQKPVRRKLHPESQSATPPSATPYSAATLTKSTQRLPPKQKREIQMAIRKNRETNAVLTRLNSELQQQLKVVHRERVTLESQLELLRPMAST